MGQFDRRGGGQIGKKRKQHKVGTVTKTPGHAHAGARGGEDAPPTTSSGGAGSSGQVCWAFHPIQRDEDNVQQPLSSAVVRANMQALLVQGRDSYREGFGMVTRMNPEVAELVRRHTVSARNQGRYERSRSLFGYNDDSDASDTEEEAAMAGVPGTANFGRQDAMGTEPCANLRVPHVRDAALVKHAHPLFHSVRVVVPPARNRSQWYRLGPAPQPAYRAQQANHQGFHAPDRPQNHGAALGGHVAFDRLCCLG